MRMFEPILNELGYSNINFQCEFKIQNLGFDFEIEKNGKKYYFIELMNPSQNGAYETHARGHIMGIVHKLKKAKNGENAYDFGLIVPNDPIFCDYITRDKVYNDIEVVIYSENGEFMNSEILKKIIA